MGHRSIDSNDIFRDSNGTQWRLLTSSNSRPMGGGDLRTIHTLIDDKTGDTLACDRETLDAMERLIEEPTFEDNWNGR